jgi:hypothetical protein
MWKQHAIGATSYNNMHFITEDPRPGHNVMYIGRDQQAFDSVSLKPLWGLTGSMKHQSTNSNKYGGAFNLQSNTTGQEFSNQTYMLLAGAHPCGYGRNQYRTTVANPQTTMNVSANNWANMDNEQRPTQHFIKDNGDGTHDLMLNSMMHGYGRGHEYYAEAFHYTSIPDDMELYEVSPNYQYQTTTTTGYRGLPMGYSALDGTNSGFLVMAHGQSGYPQYPVLTSHKLGTSPVGESNGAVSGTSVGHYAQFCGMSRSDGMPIFFEMRHALHDPHFKVCKYNGSTWSTLFQHYNNTNGYIRFRYYSTSGGSQQSWTTYKESQNGTDDAFMTLASCWFRHSSQPDDMYYTVLPNSYLGTPYADIIRWDRSTDTFAGAGLNGVSTQYATAYHRDGTGTNWNWFSSYVENAYAAAYETGAERPTSPFHSGSDQSLSYALACDAHGFANANGSTESHFSTEQYPDDGNVLPVTFMNMTQVDGAYDTRAQGRALFCTTVYATGNAYNGGHQARSVTWVPETVMDWVWCDSGKTTIAAICKNATYIYQCRKGASLTGGSNAGNRAYPGASGDLNTNTFNNTINSNAIAWIHTATIPYQVIQLGIDKHDRLWYITHEAAGAGYALNSANNSQYHKQMWMLTTATPHKVNLTGNATTDTISYSGSNIDKTLTIEALNFKGQRLAKTITLNITSTNAQFDNGSQTKDVTTSASATVNETITVTGAGSFNITAAYGA